MLKKLGKLLKYEFRFYFRILAPLYPVIMLLALAMRFQGLQSRYSSALGLILLSLLFGAIMVAMSVITTVLIIQRYTDNFLKDTGSLMFSLPVTVFALLASKAIAALCMVMIGFLTTIVSVVISTIKTDNWNIIISFIPDKPKDIIFSVTAGLSTFLQQICLFYAVITVSYKLPRFRIPAAVAMYFLVMFFIQQHTPSIFTGNATAPLVSMSLVYFILAAAFFCTTWFLLKRSYNLE